MLLLLIWLPFLGFLGAGCFGRWLGLGAVYFTISTTALAFLTAFYLFNQLFFSNDTFTLFITSWIEVDSLNIAWEIMLDSLNISLACIVTFISTLVHLYSSEYMREDPHIQRFMCYLSLFTFFMMVLVTGNNFIQMFVGWEGVGLSSYLLINFWFTRIQANKSAIKAMLFNRVADFFMILGLCSIYTLFDTFDYTVIFSVANLMTEVKFVFGSFECLAIDIICIFLFLGAMGKSAQLGFHNWLPDAMEGPTPVSALIHAATMVTAGVFLLMRCSYLFELSVVGLQFVAIVGAITALFGATVGLYAHDLKRVIAFSTCSQLGYMMLACGLEQYNTAFFHLVSHAFFKALLFLTAGAIIHSAFDEQDTRKMGGFLRYLPLTYVCFLIGSLNLVGTPFLGGFYTKDMILELAASTYTTTGCFCWGLGVISVIGTAFYSTRVLFLIFFRTPNANKNYIKQVHESGTAIKIPLIVLSIISIIAGGFGADMFYGLGTPFFSTALFFNAATYNNGDAEFLPMISKITPFICTFSGMLWFGLQYSFEKRSFFKLKTSGPVSLLYKFLIKKWYFDRTVNQVIALPTLIWVQYYAYMHLDRGLLEVLGPTTVAQGSEEAFYPKSNAFKDNLKAYY